MAETRLEQATRHLAEQEQRIAEQEERIKNLAADGHSVKAAQELLADMVRLRETICAELSRARDETQKSPAETEPLDENSLDNVMRLTPL